MVEDIKSSVWNMEGSWEVGVLVENAVRDNISESAGQRSGRKKGVVKEDDL